MTAKTIPLRRAVAPSPHASLPGIHGLHHYAYRCRDAEETRHFYEDILGLPLAAAVTHDHVPSTGEFSPYYHIFFEMSDGSYIAFFDLLDGQGSAPDPDTPAWVNHLALEVESLEALETYKKRLQDAGVDVLGIVDHKWFNSIYFFDPNGIRLELVQRTASVEEMQKKYRGATGVLSGRQEKIEAVAKKGRA
jgi:glyoxylase I family protein